MREAEKKGKESRKKSRKVKEERTYSGDFLFLVFVYVLFMEGSQRDTNLYERG